MGKITKKKIKENKMIKINQLRNFFDSLMIDGYLVPKNDEYFNEYVSQSKDR